jgi:hypothetical protein
MARAFLQIVVGRQGFLICGPDFLQYLPDAITERFVISQGGYAVALTLRESVYRFAVW